MIGNHDGQHHDCKTALQTIMCQASILLLVGAQLCVVLRCSLSSHLPFCFLLYGLSVFLKVAPALPRAQTLSQTCPWYLCDTMLSSCQVTVHGYQQTSKVFLTTLLVPASGAARQVCCQKPLTRCVLARLAKHTQMSILMSISVIA